MPSLVGRPLRVSESGLGPTYYHHTRTPLMRERSEILKSKSDVLHPFGVMGGGGGGGVSVGGSRPTAERLGRAVSVEATTSAAAATAGTGATAVGHATPEGLASPRLCTVATVWFCEVL